ncbi:MAG TPA: 2-C-methyl-D-erythritol 4-phosphate cytidylyltransferase [Desulfitobacteriaceae bacterium]|nr:2-C-methyl-D-erythritol 4-phosphate cytidylyltransferase [Desulfitobacteriaceae bacterium]
MDKVGVVIPAAGCGKRMGVECNKQFLDLAGFPILAHTVKVFQISRFVSEIVVVGAENDITRITEMIRNLKFDKALATIGGSQRQDSVFRGVQALSPAARRVVVHDGARPLLTLEQFNRFLNNSEGFSAAITAIPVKDTIKRITETGLVAETPPREYLRAAQTPQIFERSVLEKVHKIAAEQRYYGTDDASLFEWQGYPVTVLEGYPENIKITTPEDLWLAEYVIKQRGTLL